MADGNGNNGNGMGNASKEVLSFLCAEAVSIGAATLFYTLLPPRMLKWATPAVRETCITPFQDTIEKALGSKVDYTRSRLQRADDYAEYLTRFGLSAGISFGTELGARWVFNKALHVKEPASNLAVTCMDKGSHLGLIIAANTIFSKQTDMAIEATSNVVQKGLGWPKDRADRLGDVTWRWEGANWASALFTSAFVFGRQMWGRGKH